MSESTEPKHDQPALVTPTHVPLLLRIPSPLSGTHLNEPVGPPPGLPFPIEVTKDSIKWGSSRKPTNVKWITSETEQECIKSFSVSESEPRPIAEYEEYMKDIKLKGDRHPRVNPPPSPEVLIANGLGPDDVDPQFTTPEYVNSSTHVGAAQRSGQSDVDPKTVVINYAKKPPKSDAGSPLRYVAMLANSAKAAQESGARVVVKFQ